MSNPGVLYLTNKKINNKHTLRIEDNIGEAIHIHYGDELRIDLTVSEFLSLQERADGWIECLLAHAGFKSKFFDPFFLDMISDHLVDLESVEFDNIKLSDIKVQTVNAIGLPIVRRINKSRIVKALKGNTKELNSYKQENFREQNNQQRLDGIQKKVLIESYPFDNQYMVFFNDQNNIRDGQHRAGVLYCQYDGEKVVPIIRMRFRNGKHKANNHPWIGYVFNWHPSRIKRGIRKILSLTKQIIKRVIRRLIRLFSK